MNTLTRKKKIIFTIVVVFIFFLAAELVARFVLNNNGAISIAERKNTFEPYQNKPWTEQYFKDEALCGEQHKQSIATSSFVRYVMYDVGYPGCKSQTINYFGGNMRKTWGPDYDTNKLGLKIYSVAFFGGSTTQGAGVPDDLTIPSQFSKLANTATSSVVYRVENYGVSGYTYTQAIVKLAFLLREGKKFDYVIFYNGVNDIDNAYEAGIAGAFYGEKTIKNRLYGGLSGQSKEKFKDQLNSCGLCRFIITFSRNTPFLKDHFTPYLVRVRKFLYFKEGVNKRDEDIAPFAQSIADYYKESHGLLDHLSKAYGFKYIEFWQPTLMYEDGPIAGEKLYLSIDNHLTDEKLKTLYRMTSADVVSAKLNNFYDVSDALVSRTKAHYLDWAHLDDEGNAIMAKRIYEVFQKNR
jgi:lysophospholipase L1-like esterase